VGSNTDFMTTTELIQKLQELDPEGNKQIEFLWGYSPHIEKQVDSIEVKENTLLLS